MYLIEYLENWPEIVIKRLLRFAFKHKILSQYQRKIENIERNQEINNSCILLMFLFSPRIIVGLIMYFREYLVNYIKPFKYLFFTTSKKLSYKIFILSCLNFRFFKNELLKINYLIFLFYEFYWKQIKCTSFNASFFNYGLLLDNCTNASVTCVIENQDFLFKLSFRSFYYFFCYAEHFRLMKYNEYILGHISLSKNIFNFLLRKVYITLYYNWQMLDSSLVDGYVSGYRKGLLGKVYLLYYGSRFTERRMKFLFTTLEARILTLDFGFSFLNLLNINKSLWKFISKLNRQAIRHTIRFIAYTQVMKKDRKWKRFHVLVFETWLDFIFSAFKKTYALPVYKIIMKQCEKKLLNWQLRQSFVYLNYFWTDLLIFKKWGRLNPWEYIFWDELYLHISYINLLITNLFNDFFIRIIGQLDFSFLLTWETLLNFYHRYRENFYDNLLFYSWETSIYSSESVCFVLDYFLWRIWYSHSSFSLKTLDVYNFTSTYDKLLQNRYFSLETLFKLLWRNLKFEPFSSYVLIRDLIYKNLINNFKIIVLIFFLKLKLKSISNNILLYDYKCQINFYNFWEIAPEYEREINLNYITDLLVMDVKKSRKKSIQDTYIW